MPGVAGFTETIRPTMLQLDPSRGRHAGTVEASSASTIGLNGLTRSRTTIVQLSRKQERLSSCSETTFEGHFIKRGSLTIRCDPELKIASRDGPDFYLPQVYYVL
jgi:hypothetical protein